MIGLGEIDVGLPGWVAIKRNSEPVQVGETVLKPQQNAALRREGRLAFEDRCDHRDGTLLGHSCSSPPNRQLAALGHVRSRSVSWADLESDFGRLKTVRRGLASTSLDAAGKLGSKAIASLVREFPRRAIRFTGGGGKEYSVFTVRGSEVRFSRPVRNALFISDVDEFDTRWAEFCDAVQASAGRGAMAFDPVAIDRLVYSAVIAFACTADLYGQGGRGAPGTFLEMVVGPLVALLSGRAETSSISIPVPETGEVERVPTDLSFVELSEPIVLVVPTKISTRERISQAYVHQRILDAARPGDKAHRSILVVANENNVMAPKGVPPAGRTVDACTVQDTLVPSTIVLYQKYVAQLSGLYYLDPPSRYIAGDIRGFPTVRSFGQLLTGDLAALLQE